MPEKTHSVTLATGDKINLLPLSQFQNNFEGLYLFNFNLKTKDISSLVYAKIDSSQISLKVLTENGITIGTIEYDGQNADVDCSFIPEGPFVYSLIFEIQCILYDKSLLKEKFAEKNLEFAAETEGSGSEEKEIRKILKNGQCIQEFSISKKCISVSNSLRNYSYSLELLQN